MALLLFGLVILFSFQSLFCRLYTSSRNGAGAIPFSVAYALIVGGTTLAARGFSYHPSGATVGLGLLNAVMLLLYNVSMLRAGARGSYAFLMVSMLAGGILVPMVYDVFYVGAWPDVLGLFGVAAMLAAFVLMNLDGFKGEKSGGYLVWCAVNFLVNGFYTVLMHFQQTIMVGTQREEMIVTTFLGMAFFTAAFELLFHRRAFLAGFHMPARSAAFLIISAVCATVAVNLLLFIMRQINLTVLNVVNNGGVLALSVLYALVLFRERPAPRTIAGLALACASIVVLSL